MSALPRYRGVLFDLDGTLADTAPDLAAAVNRMRERRGLQAMDLALLRPVASHGARGLLGAGLEVGPEHPEWEAMRAEFLHEYATRICVHTQLFPGMQQVLDALRQHGLPWGIVTNKAEVYTSALLRQLRLDPAPGCVVSGDTTARPKPAPDGLLHAAAVLGVEPGRCVYLGDDLRDMQAAAAAGMATAAAAYGYGGAEEARRWGAQHVLDAPEDVLNWL